MNRYICIGLDKGGGGWVSSKYFSYFSTKTYIVGTHKKCLNEALLMSTYNICFPGEIRKISILLD